MPRWQRRCRPAWIPHKPPHVGVLLQNTPFFSAVLVAAGSDGHRAGRASTRSAVAPRCSAISRTRIAKWCSLIRRRLATVGDIDHIDVDSPEWAAEVAAHRRRSRSVAYQADPTDLFMLIYTSGTSGDPKAVICSQGKVAIAGAMMTATVRSRTV